MSDTFFHSWDSLLRTLIVGVLAYCALVVFLRISGKRTLSKFNAFDLIVTVALGSTLATILLNRNVPLAEGLLAYLLLIGMQFAVTWSSIRFPWIRRMVTGEPTLLLYRGVLMPTALRRTRVTEEEVQAAVRSAGLTVPDQAEAVVLETDGSFSVIPRNDERSRPPGIAGLKLPDRQ